MRERELGKGGEGRKGGVGVAKSVLLSQKDPWSHIHTCNSMPVTTSTPSKRFMFNRDVCKLVGLLSGA